MNFRGIFAKLMPGLVCLMTATIVAAQPAPPETVKGVTLPVQPIALCQEDAEVYPWILKEGQGLVTIVLKMAADATGLVLSQQRASWLDCLAMVKSGAVAGVILASYSDERASYAAYPMAAGGLDEARRLIAEEYVLYRRKGSPVTWDGTRIRGLSGPIGIQTGYSIGRDLLGMEAQVDERNRSAEEAMMRLAKGEVEAIALLSLTGSDLQRRPEYAGLIESVKPALVSKPYFLIFNKLFYQTHKSDVESLWDAIAVARASRRYQAIESAVVER